MMELKKHLEVLWSAETWREIAVKLGHFSRCFMEKGETLDI